MCHSRANHSKIDLHERCLRINYSDKTSSFEALLEKDGSVSIHNKHLRLLAIEIYKACKGLSPPIITELFEKKNDHQYSLTERGLFLGPKIWDILPDRLKLG